MRVAVYCGANEGNKACYREAAVSLGQWIGQEGHVLVYGGGKVGLMGVVADTVLGQPDGQAVGVIPQFLVDHEVGHEGLTKLIIVETMRERKQKMIDLADAFIAFPGGPGTLEEISEVISWARLGKLKQPCIFYNVNGFYDTLAAQFDRMVEDGFLTETHRKQICISDSLAEIQNFIANYKPAGLYE